VTTSIFGSAVLRSEDPRFLRGAGRYVENVAIERAARAVFVRSMMAHARITGIDCDAARGMPGVADVLTARDLNLPPLASSGNTPDAFARPALAGEVARYVGEPIAVVIAGTAAQAEDAAELVAVEYEPMPTAVGAMEAIAEGAPVLFPDHGSNVCHRFGTEDRGDPLEGCEVVARGRFVNQRLAPAPMETNAFAAIPEPDGGLTVWVSSQVPFDIRGDVADALGLELDAVRAIAPDVGGGFGAKLVTYPEYLVIAAAAVRLFRPIRWAESRGESMTGLTHGRAQVQDVELGARRDGTIVGLRVQLTADVGAYPIGAYLAPITQEMLSGVYRIPRISCSGRSVVSNTTPVAAYRGAGRPEATALLERAMDLLAAELGMDPVELRRRNLIPADAFPYTTAVGTTYDSGDYAGALEAVLDRAGYDRLRREQAARRAASGRRQLGVGVSVYLEITAWAGKEFGSVEVHDDGSVTVLTGVSPHGQGHETSLAQIAAGVLGVPFGSVRVVHSDTAVVPRGEGTWGSRSLQMGGSAVWERSHDVLRKGMRLAAHLLEVGEEDVRIDGSGGVGVAGAPDLALSWGDLVRAANDPSRRPAGMEPGMSSAGRFAQRDATFPFGAHIAVAEVDVETGDARLVRHIAVDDCGRILNPLLVDGQVHGGLAQGIAQALYEAMEYDENGTPLTASFSTYGIPSAAEMPRFETGHTQTPTPLNPLGAKGIGEAATIGSTPAVQNAVIDAIAHLGVRHIDMPLTPERVWRAIREARGDRSSQPSAGAVNRPADGA
jgi:carbon-monoxide dehydrogenase large subunit